MGLDDGPCSTIPGEAPVLVVQRRLHCFFASIRRAPQCSLDSRGKGRVAIGCARLGAPEKQTRPQGSLGALSLSIV